MSSYDKRTIPPFVNVGKHERMINLSALTLGQRKTIWIGMKAANPDLANMLQPDENIDELKQQLGAFIQLNVADLNRYMEAGLKVIEEKNP
ncbi:MAG: hypothetical protein WAW41_10230 [Methylobacter sp.]